MAEIEKGNFSPALTSNAGSKLSSPSDMKESEYNFICSQGEVEIHRTGSTLFNEGESLEHIYVILAGKVRVFSKNNKGKKVILDFKGPEEYLNEIALIENSPSLVSAIAVEHVVLSKITRNKFNRCLQDRPEIAINLLRILTCRVSTMTSTIKSLALDSMGDRIKKLLRDNAHKINGKMIVQTPLTHREMSLMIGSSREVVSKIMSKLKENGDIEVRDRNIILNPKLLEQLPCRDAQ